MCEDGRSAAAVYNMPKCKQLVTCDVQRIRDLHRDTSTEHVELTHGRGERVKQGHDDANTEDTFGARLAKGKEPKRDSVFI